MISLGATDEPIELSAFALLFQSLGVVGALTGTPAAGDATLRFSTITDVAAMVETMPLERAAEAYAKMMAGTGTVSDGSHHGISTAPSTIPDVGGNVTIGSESDHQAILRRL